MACLAVNILATSFRNNCHTALLGKMKGANHKASCRFTLEESPVPPDFVLKAGAGSLTTVYVRVFTDYIYFTENIWKMIGS